MLTVYHYNLPVNITIDSGATTSFITREKCLQLELVIKPNGKLIKLGDGCTTLAAIGEVNAVFSRDKWTVKFRAIVVESLSSDLYGGMTFLIDNDISLRPKVGEIKILNKFLIYQTNTLMLPPQIRSMQFSLQTVKIPKGKIYPAFKSVLKSNVDLRGLKALTHATIELPNEMKNCIHVLISPRHENKVEDWPVTQLCSVDEGKITIRNDTDKIISIPSDVHLIGVSPTYEYSMNEIIFDSSNYECNYRTNDEDQKLGKISLENAEKIDISRVSPQLQDKLRRAHRQYADVFSPDLTKGYNGHSGIHMVRLQFADDNRPMMNKCKIPKWAGKYDKIKQKKMDSLEAQGVLVDPYKHNVKIKMVSPCFLRVKARAKEKELNECDLSEIRWIISPSQLNPYLRQLQTKNVTKEDLFVFKSERPFCIEFDMYDGYFQNHVHKDDWGFLAVETPFKGIRVLTRSGQGLLNQEIEMAQLLTKVLGKEIEKGNVMIAADDGQVGGSDEETAIDNWITVLKLCSDNNIKLGYNKVKIFPETSLIHGWVFKDGHIQPDPHRTLALLDIKPPKTVGEMRTFMGVFKTFFPAMPRLSNLMSPFEKLCAAKESKEKLDWNEDLEKAFNESKTAAKESIKSLALPHPDEQLFIVPDAACRDAESKKPALGFILFVQREPRARPVMFVSWRMGDDYWSWSPCDLEGLGASLAVEKCSFYILRSNKPTLVFPDNKCVIQAFEKLKKGRYSTSQRLATFTNKMQRFPIIMQHGSGKLLQNIGSDYISRNAPDCKNNKCATCAFAKEGGDTILANLINLVGSGRQELDLHKNFTELSTLSHSRDTPLGNNKAWLELQSNDFAISEAIKLKKSGQQPAKATKHHSEIKFYVTNCNISSSSRLLVKEDSIPFNSQKLERIIVPQEFLEPLLIQLHIDQNCPEPSQLKKLFERYFFAFQPKNIYQSVTSYCRSCQARKKLPKELKHFTSITNPNGPGLVFVIDVMRRAKQFILVSRDAFSDYVTSSLVASETAGDLKEGIITTTNGVRSHSSITVRTDSAPGFVALRQNKDLSDLGIRMDISDNKNKNGVAIVDKAIQELQKELVILSPEGSQITSSILSRATTALNSRIRNRNLSAYEIMFSREQTTGTNLHLDDSSLAESKMEKKIKNHKFSEKSKFGRSKIPDIPENLKIGDFVHLKEDRDKHRLRDLYMVTSVEGDDVILLKVIHGQNRSKTTKLSSKKLKTVVQNIYKADNISRCKIDSYPVPEISNSGYPSSDSEQWTVFPRKTISSSGSSTLEEDREATSPLVNYTVNSGPPEKHTVDSGPLENHTVNSGPPENHTVNSGPPEISIDNLGGETEEEVERDSLILGEQDSQDMLETSKPTQISEKSYRRTHPGELRVAMYTDEELPFVDGKFIQRPPPRKNDIVYFFHRRYMKWVRAKLISNELRGYKNYHNIEYDDGSKDGVYLIQNERWTLWNKTDEEPGNPLNRVINFETLIPI